MKQQTTTAATDTELGRAIFAALQTKSHVYAGTVPLATRLKRRVQNRRARASRRGAHRA